MSRKKKTVDFWAWQKCPVCDGVGYTRWMDISTCVSREFIYDEADACKVCNKAGIISIKTGLPPIKQDWPMKKTDIPETVSFNDANGQEWKNQKVATPYGFIWVRCNTRVPKLSASKRQWDLWFIRFVQNREHHEYMNAESRATFESWQKRFHSKTGLLWQ